MGCCGSKVLPEVGVGTDDSPWANEGGYGASSRDPAGASGIAERSGDYEDGVDKDGSKGIEVMQLGGFTPDGFLAGARGVDVATSVTKSMAAVRAWGSAWRMQAVQ